MNLKDLTSLGRLCNNYFVSGKRKSIIAVFGTVLLALFSFQLIASSLLAAGLLPDDCISVHATSNASDNVIKHTEDNSTKDSSQQPSNHCSCSCHHANFGGFLITQADLFLNSVVQDKVSPDDVFPSDGLARLIYLPPRLS